MNVRTMTRDDIIAYSERENEVNQYGAPKEAFATIADLVMYMGRELCRPITRLLLANWRELQGRLASFKDSEWELPSKVADESGLDKRSVALLIEVLEGQDTIIQAEAGKTTLTAAERAMIQEHLQASRTEVPAEQEQ